MTKLLAYVFSALLSTLNPVWGAELTILTENLPPLNFTRDGKLVGPSVEIVEEIQRRVGSTATIHVYPWARAYQRALQEKNIVLFGTTHTSDRQDKFKWVGPLAAKRDILVAKKGSGIVIDSLDDARKVRRIGTLRDDSREQFLRVNGFDNLELVADEQQNARKLVHGRIDLWAYKVPGLKTVCELAGINFDEVEEVFSLREIDVSIAFSIKTSDTIVLAWQNAFDQMTADGTLSRIKEKWHTE
ncbi:substrate-binding periplasmic protein [Pseudomonadota bacterium]